MADVDLDALERHIAVWNGARPEDMRAAAQIQIIIAAPALIAELRRLRGQTTPCEWREDADGNWWTSCDNIHAFITAGPVENRYKFCPYCGKPLTTTNYSEPGPTG